MSVDDDAWWILYSVKQVNVSVCLCVKDLSSWKQKRKSRTTYQHAQDLINAENLNNDEAGRRKPKTFNEMIQNRWNNWAICVTWKTEKKHAYRQGHPVNVKHDARCVMGKVGGKTKTQKGGIFIYCYKSISYQLCDYKIPQNPHTTICTICYLLSRGHRSLLWIYDSQTHSSRSSDLWPQDNSR